MPESMVITWATFWKRPLIEIRERPQMPGECSGSRTPWRVVTAEAKTGFGAAPLRADRRPAQKPITERPDGGSGVRAAGAGFRANGPSPRARRRRRQPLQVRMRDGVSADRHERMRADAAQLVPVMIRSRETASIAILDWVCEGPDAGGRQVGIDVLEQEPHQFLGVGRPLPLVGEIHAAVDAAGREVDHGAMAATCSTTSHHRSTAPSTRTGRGVDRQRCAVALEDGQRLVKIVAVAIVAVIATKGAGAAPAAAVAPRPSRRGGIRPDARPQADRREIRDGSRGGGSIRAARPARASPCAA